MKTISGATTTKLAAPITQPGYLIRIDWPASTAPVYSAVTQYFSTLSDIPWSGHTWLGADVTVSGLSQDGTGASSATLTIGNTDLAMSALVLQRGAADVPVSIWAVYSTTPAAGDLVQVFAGVTNGADIGPDKVSLSLVAQNNATLQSPRVFINKDSGFHFLQPEGTKVTWGNEVFELKK